MYRSDRWRYEEVDWSTTGCTACVERVAVLLYDGYPMCADCADGLLQRQAAISMVGRLIERDRNGVVTRVLDAREAFRPLDGSDAF